MTRFPSAPVLCLAAVATLACAAPALAQNSDTVPSVTVKYSDLNISSQAGAQRLLKRIDGAADSVCGGMPDVRQLSQLTRFEACRRSALARAVAAVDSPVLTAMAHHASPGSLAAR